MVIAKLTDSTIDVGHELDNFKVHLENSGAIVTFSGLVRGKDGDKVIESLTLEHYPGMTQKQMHLIATQAKERFSLSKCLAIHRYGTLYPGETIVFVAAAAPHRKAAFQGAEFLMDWLKTKAPFWKREETQSGTTWVSAKAKDDTAAAHWDKFQDPD